MTYSVRNIVIALVLAAVAAGLVILYTGNVTKQGTIGLNLIRFSVTSSRVHTPRSPR